MKNSRRNFIKGLAYTGGVLGYAASLPNVFAQAEYGGKLLITVQYRGAWDVSSFCDPKENVKGELEINHWARNDEIRKAGNVRFAPYGSNQVFFEKHYQKTLVINGVDMQTNAHETGEIHSWSGRTAVVFPSVTALLAATNGSELPMSLLNFGGFGNTEGIIGSTHINGAGEIRDILYPNAFGGRQEDVFLSHSDWNRVREAQIRNLTILSSKEGLAAQNRLNRQIYLDAFSKAESLKIFADLIPKGDELQKERTLTNGQHSTLHQQVQMALLAFKSGLSVSADLDDGGYDTHAFHDRNHEPMLANGIDAIDYLWDFAEELGLADRLVVVLGSDFSRTPYYNSGEGKDHWAIGSYVIMEKNVSYTNQVIGETDEGQNAFPINPTTLERDNFGGVIIRPAHVHKALRKYLGLENSEFNKIFPFNNTEDFNFFG
jgi:hypothetical protein